MIYLLDTNACIALLRENDTRVAQRFATTTASTLQRLTRFLRLFESFPFDDAAADVYGRLRALLDAQGVPIGPNDLMIAAIALANNLMVVTNNTREFRRIPGLLIEDWS